MKLNLNLFSLYILYVCFFISGCAPVVASSGFAKTTSLANTSAVNNGDSQNPSVHNPSLNEKIALAVEDNFRKNYEKLSANAKF